MSKIVNVIKKTGKDTLDTTVQMTAAAAVVSPVLAGAQIISSTILRTGVKPGAVIKQTVAGAASIIVASAATSIIINGVANTVSEIRSSKTEVNNNFNDDDLDEADEVVEE